MKRFTAIAILLILTIAAVFATEGGSISLEATISDKPVSYSIYASKTSTGTYVQDAALTYSGSGQDIGTTAGVTVYLNIRRSACSYKSGNTANLTITFNDLTMNGLHAVPAVTVTRLSGTITAISALSAKKITASQTFDAKTHYSKDDDVLTLSANYTAGDSAATLPAGDYKATIVLTYTTP